MNPVRPRPVVHLELHTPDRAAAGAFYQRLLAWRPELIEMRCGSYLALGLGGGIDVRLLWDARTNRVSLALTNERSGESLTFEVDPGEALAAFHHPYACAR